jgi:hypothetical protein
VQRAPGIPHALFGRRIQQRLGRFVPRDCEAASAHNGCCLKIEIRKIRRARAPDHSIRTVIIREGG